MKRERQQIVITLFVVLFISLFSANAKNNNAGKGNQILTEGTILYNPKNIIYDTLRHNWIISDDGFGTDLPIINKDDNNPLLPDLMDGYIVIVTQNWNEEDHKWEEYKLPNISIRAPGGMVLFGDSLYIVDQGYNKILGYRLSDSSVFMTYTIDTATAQYYKYGFRDLVKDNNRNLYIAGQFKNRLYKFNIDSLSFTELAITGDTLRSPIGLYYEESNSRILIVSCFKGDNPIQAFNPATLNVTTLKTLPKTKLFGITKDLDSNAYYLTMRDTADFHEMIYRFRSNFNGDPDTLTETYSRVAGIYYNNYNDTLVWITRGGDYYFDFLHMKSYVSSPRTPILISPPDSATGLNPQVRLECQFQKEAWIYNYQISKQSTFDSVYIEKYHFLSPSLLIYESLDSGVTYYWRVRTVNGGGKSDWSQIRRFTISNSYLPKVKLKNFDHGNMFPKNYYVNFKWHPQTWAVSYKLRFQLINGSPVEYTTTDTNFSMTGFNPLHYLWFVQAIDSSGRSSWSNRSEFAILDTLIVPPVPKAPADKDQEVTQNPTFTWLGNYSPSYNFQLIEYPENAKDINDLEKAFDLPKFKSSGIKDTLLKPTITLTKDKKYAWRIQSNNNQTTSPWSSVASFVVTKQTDITEPNTNAEFEVYPNPATNDIQIKLSNVKGIIRSIEITDLFGQKIKEVKNLQNDSETFIYNFNIENINAGIYFARIQLDNSIMSKKLIIAR